MTRILLSVALLCPCLAAQTMEPKGITVSDAIYDFGTVKQGSKITHAFTVKNNTSAPLTIQSVELSMPAMHARFAPLVAPGGEGKLTVEWDTSHIAGEMDGEANVLFADSSQPPATLQLKGVVRRPLEILPLPAVFLSAFRGEDNECRLKIVNNEEAPVAISAAVVSSKHFTASLSAVEPGRVYELAAKISPATLPGRYDEELSLSTDNPKLPGITIPVHLFVKPDLYANPETVDFGRVSVAELRKNPGSRELLKQTFLVKKREGEFEISKVISNVAGIELSQNPSHGKGSTYRIDVSLDPEKIHAGTLDGFIEIETDDRDFPLIKVPVTGTIF